MDFKPNYKNIEDAAFNRKPERLPLYEHLISDGIMEQIMDKKFSHFANTDLDEYFKNFCGFFKQSGYDCVSYEACICEILPFGGALGGNKKGVITDRKSFEEYPWDDIYKIFFERFPKRLEALRRNMPENMKAVGGVGNGIFEVAQDLVGFEELCYMKIDDFELYQELFSKIGDVLCKIWIRFLEEYGDIYCVLRFGDDLGFKSNTLLEKKDIVDFIIPQYKKIVEIVHSHNKPFLLHSCGAIFPVMDEIISIAKIDAKHSNEDQIAFIETWVEKYGDKIGNFGGLDTDVLCDGNKTDIVEYTTNVFNHLNNKNGGAAIGSGNSIPNYVSVERYKKMLETVNKLRS